VDHPSQTRHTLCLFSTPEDWIDLYLDNAFRDLDLTKVEDLWFKELIKENLIPDIPHWKKYADRLWTDIKDE